MGKLKTRKKRKPDVFDFYIILFIVVVCVLGIAYLVAVWRSDLPLWMKFFLTSSRRC